MISHGLRYTTLLDEFLLAGTLATCLLIFQSAVLFSALASSAVHTEVEVRIGGSADNELRWDRKSFTGRIHRDKSLLGLGHKIVPVDEATYDLDSLQTVLAVDDWLFCANLAVWLCVNVHFVWRRRRAKRLHADFEPPTPTPYVEDRVEDRTEAAQVEARRAAAFSTVEEDVFDHVARRPMRSHTPCHASKPHQSYHQEPRKAAPKGQRRSARKSRTDFTEAVDLDGETWEISPRYSRGP